MTENNGKISGASVFVFVFFLAPHLFHTVRMSFIWPYTSQHTSFLFYFTDFILAAQTFHFSDRLKNPI